MPGLRYREDPETHRPAVFSDVRLKNLRWRAVRAAERFRGITTSDGLVPGLFPLRRTGIDLSQLTQAVCEYLSALSPRERIEGRFPIEHASWRQWTNGARYFMRHGLLLEDLEPGKRDRALDVLRQSLSQAGFTQVLDMMHLNRTIGEIRDEVNLLNEWVYWFSVYGEPESGQPWGWQLDGHHVNLNCVIVGDQMTLTPAFLGAEPVFAEAGKYAGTRAFGQEESKACDFFATLSPSQKSLAVVGDAMPEDVLGRALFDNREINYEGIRFDQLSPEQLTAASDLLAVYVNRIRDDEGRVRMAEVLGRAPETYFTWMGETGPGGVFYYRIYSPVILVEFEHLRGAMFDNDTRTRNHVHTVIRTPNGNDYGRDLLRQHHELCHSQELTE